MRNIWLKYEPDRNAAGHPGAAAIRKALFVLLVCAACLCALVLRAGNASAEDAYFSEDGGAPDEYYAQDAGEVDGLIDDGAQDSSVPDGVSDEAFKDLEASRSLDEKTAGPPADVSEVSVSPQEMMWYVRGIGGKPEDVALYAGTQRASVSEHGMLGEEGGPAPRTLILMDNSNSVAHSFPDGPDRINAILTRLIWNHQPGELFAIKTFSDHTETVLDFTDNYDELRLSLENIVYQDQDTYLRNVLYEQIYELMTDGAEGYKRIIVVSDGTDDSRLGVTYEEVTDLIIHENYFLPIYTIATDYLPAEGELDKLFALSRKTDTPYFFLPEFENPTDIADGIVADGHQIAYFRMPIMAAERTGEYKTYTLSFSAGGESYTLNHRLMMPPSSDEDLATVLAAREKKRQEEEAAALAAAEQESEAQRAYEEDRQGLEDRISALEERETDDAGEDLQALAERIAALEQAQKVQESEDQNALEEAAGILEEAETETESEVYGYPVSMMEKMLSENREYFFVRSIRSVIWAVIGVILLLLISYIVYGDRTRKNRREFEEVTASKTEKMVEPDLSTSLEKGVILYDMGEPDVQYVIEVGQDQTLGRSKARSNIAFPMDRYMAGRQARIFFREGKVYIENLDPDKKTKLNDRVLEGTAELENGARLTLGSTELRVQYE